MSNAFVSILTGSGPDLPVVQSCLGNAGAINVEAICEKNAELRGKP